MIVGHDARDGALRWSVTVRRLDTAQLNQVAVGEGCSVLVLIGTVLLAVDTYSGKGGGQFGAPERERRCVALHDAGAWPVSVAAAGRSA